MIEQSDVPFLTVHGFEITIRQFRNASVIIKTNKRVEATWPSTKADFVVGQIERQIIGNVNGRLCDTVMALCY